MSSIAVAPNAFPNIDAHLSSDGTAKVFISGTPHDIAAADLPAAQALRPSTQRAWLAAGAAVAKGL